MAAAAPIAQIDTTASNTKGGYTSARKKWDEFVATQNPLLAQADPNHEPIPTSDNLTENFVCGRVLENGSMESQCSPPIGLYFGQFAQFLLDDKKKDGDPYAPMVSVQYFCNMKIWLFNQFKPLGFTGADPEWYMELLRGLKMRARAECIKRGGKITNKATGFPRKVLLACLRFLMEQDNEALGCEERVVIATLFHAVGRASEVEAMTWESARWEEERGFLANIWGEYKNGNQYEMTFHSEKEGWLLDFIHAMACYLICAPRSYTSAASAQETGVHFIFPQYKLSDGGAADKISKIIDKCRKGGVEGIPDAAASHGIRVSATDEMLFNTELPFFAAIARGGWKCACDALVFYYLTQKVHVASAGKALAGWPHPNADVKAPTLDAIRTDENEEALNLFCQNLFMFTPISGLLNTELKGFRDTMVASLLMHLKSVKATLKSDCLVAKAIRGASEGIVNPQVILEWGDKIKQQYGVDNAYNAAEGSGEERAIAAFSFMKGTCLEMMDQTKKVYEKVDETKDVADSNASKLDNLTDMMGDLHSMVGNLSLGSPASSPRRKSRRVGNMNNVHAASLSPLTSVGETSSNDSGTANPPPVVVDPLARIASSQARADCVDWINLGKNWDSKMLLMHCLKHRQNPDSKFFLSVIPTSKRSVRARAKLLLIELKYVATRADPENAQFFQYNLNHGGEMEAAQYYAEAGGRVDAWASVVKDEAYQRKKSGLAGKALQRAIKTERAQKMNVTALAGLLENNPRARPAVG